MGQDEVDEEVGSALAVAREARGRAHAPYSAFQVGAALVTSSGRVFSGCNVESASYGLTLCAERGALAGFVAAVDRAHREEIVLVVLSTVADRPTPPCGACRQWLAEFAPGAKVVAVADAPEGGSELARATWTVAELLPAPFTGEQLPPS